MQPIIFINGLSQFCAALIALLLALKIHDKEKQLRNPFYILAGIFTGIAVLNFLWSFNLIPMSLWDHLIVGPVFNIAFLGVWSFVSLRLSGHRHLYFLIPAFMVGGVILISVGLAPLSDVLAGAALVCSFFFAGFINNHLLRWFSFTGIIYGLVLLMTGIATHLTKTAYLNSLWFIPTVAAGILLYSIYKKGHLLRFHDCGHKDLPAIFEVLKFGMFINALFLFLAIGTLGVHEFGHSIAASLFSCAHSTSFGSGFAVTSISCPGNEGVIFIALAGFLLTAIFSALIYVTGSEYARKIGIVTGALSLFISIDDFKSIGMPESGMFLVVFISSALIVFGIASIIRSYEKEYSNHIGAAVA